MKKSFFVALFIAILAALWILSGVFKADGKASSENTSQNTAQSPENSELVKSDLIEVRVRDLTAQLMDDEVEVTGRTQASRRVMVRNETEGKIAVLNFQKGDLVSSGQMLAKLHVRDRSAKLEEARQLLNQRQIQYNASKELAEKGFNSRVRLAEKEAELKSARALVKQAQDELSRIVIKAPFGGVINQQMVELGDYLSTGSSLVEIVDLDPIEITGFLTENQVGSLQEGDVANAVLLNGQVVEGKVSFIAAAADQNTRTFKVEMTLANDDRKIKEGLTAKILVPFKESRAYKVSPSILSLADDGAVGVKVIENGDTVKFMPIKLLKDTPDHLWIGGLPENVTVITVGQEFVVSGQKVKPVYSGDIKTDNKNEGSDLL